MKEPGIDDLYQFDLYQDFSDETAIYPNKGDNLYYPALGLAGEAGEVCEKIKKIMRDQKGHITEENVKEISKELGDVLWYVAALASEINVCLSVVAEENLKKLQSRQNRGVLKGSGDNR
jgi:NTP pyrophosphatase (non-canonical NTP hydrolase)